MIRRVLWLHERKARNRGLSGGKASSLARLTALGYAIPNGFVVPAGASVLGDEAWMRVILEASQGLEWPLAVRSSLVGEDSTLWSFAGQLTTVLDLENGEALWAAIQHVCASAEQPKLRRYTERVGEARNRLAPTDASVSDEETFALAVLIQEMVVPQAAGVAFSADPLSGRATAVIEAVPERGEELAQGRANPDRFTVDGIGRLTSTTRVALSQDMLPDHAVMLIADTVRSIADQFGLPQDMEWAWANGKLLVLQARPITSLVDKSIYSKKLIGDMAPGTIKPLIWSTNTLGMVEGAFAEIFTDLIGKNDYDFRRILKRIRSHAYVNTTFIGDLLADVGLPRNFFDTVVQGDRPSRRIAMTTRLLRRMPRLVLAAWRVSGRTRALEATVREHDKELDAFRRADWSGASPRELRVQADALVAQHRVLQRCVMLGGLNLALRMKRLRRMVARHGADLRPSRLFLGLRGLKSLEPNRRLQEIAARAAPQSEDVIDALLSGDSASIRPALSIAAEGRRLSTDVDEFLEQFGFLSANGTNFGEPTWAEAPGPVWRSLGRMIREGARPLVDARLERDATRAEIEARLGIWDRRRFSKRLRSVTRFLELRERMSLLMTEDTYQLRRIFLALGARLAESGVIREANDVFLLHHDELASAVEAGAASEDVLALVEERKSEIERDREVVLPETVVGEVVPSDSFEPEQTLVLTGVSASSGFVRGTARVVCHLDEAPADLSKNDILIVPFSDVGWTPLFAAVGGVVAECGGQLSHTAIVAREYGLPAVVGVRAALRSIPDGHVVTVDGERGRVYLDGGGPETELPKAGRT